MTRARLPNRRMSESRDITVDGRTFYVMVGYDASAKPRELFIRDAKPGSTIGTLLDDASVVISLALQSGVSPADLAHSMSRAPAAPVMPSDLDRGDDRNPESIIGAAIDLLVSLENQDA